MGVICKLRQSFGLVAKEALDTATNTQVLYKNFVTEHTSDFFTYACKYRPHLFLDPKIRAGMTPLQLPEYVDEVRKGCEQLEMDIASGAIYRVIAQHESQVGEGLFISAKKSNLHDSHL